MTKDIMAPIMGDATKMGQQVAGNTFPSSNKTTAWNCNCGKNCITSKFCPECGAPKPVEKSSNIWNCSCGCQNITSKFCPDCGQPRPEQPTEWDCPSCGCKGITSKFCPECGQKKGE